MDQRSTPLLADQFAFTISSTSFPGVHHRARRLSRRARGAVAEHRPGLYMDLRRFWTKIFAVSFGMGVVSGVVMSYEFGTNWSGSRGVAGNVIGPLLAYEVLTAFFLEASFLGIMLFGCKRVRQRRAFRRHLHGRDRHADLHVLDSRANSWMQTPGGLTRSTDGVASCRSTGCRSSSIRPSLSPRAHGRRGLPHHRLRGRRRRRLALLPSGAAADADHALAWRLACSSLAPLQIVVGDLHGLNTLEYQPAKIAAIEGHWETENGRAADPVRAPRPEGRDATITRSRSRSSAA